LVQLNNHQSFMPQSRFPGVLKQPVLDDQGLPPREHQEFTSAYQLLPDFPRQFPEHTFGSIPVHCSAKTLTHHNPDPGL